MTAANSISTNAGRRRVGRERPLVVYALLFLTILQSFSAITALFGHAAIHANQLGAVGATPVQICVTTDQEKHSRPLRDSADPGCCLSCWSGNCHLAMGCARAQFVMKAEKAWQRLPMPCQGSLCRVEISGWATSWSSQAPPALS
jgi:hypothetical protein